MDFITGTILPYLFKGGLLTLATYFFGDIRRFVKSAMWQSIIQAVILGFILFLIDRFMPSRAGLLTPAAGPVGSQGDLGTDQGPLGNDQGLLGTDQGLGLLGNQGLLGTGQGLNAQGILTNLYNLLGQQRQVGGNCGCGTKAAQVGGECAF